MKKGLTVFAVAMLVLLAMSPAAMANSGNGPKHDVCVKEFMSPEDAARFDEIIAEYRAKMEGLRGNRDAHDARVELKEARRDALLELVPEDFTYRFNNFNTERQNKRSQGGATGKGNNAP